MLTRTQSTLENWILANGLIHSPGRGSRKGFDCLMVEAAPWHLAQSRLALRTETAIWATADSKKSVSVSKALGRVLREIKRFNEEKRSIFLHPDVSTTGFWQDAVHFHRREISADSREPLTPESPGAYVQPPSSTSEGLQTASYRHELRKFAIGAKNEADPGSFDECLKRALSSFTGIMRQEGVLGAPFCHCYISSLPMPLLQPTSEQGSSGVVYVYAWSSQPWSPGHESLVADLAAIAAFLYDESYSEATRAEIEQFYRQSFLVSAAHEIKRLVQQIGPSISGIYSQFFRDFLLLHLEQGLGETFLPAKRLLATNFPAALGNLSEISYIFRMLCDRKPNTAEVNEEFVAKCRGAARALIVVEGNPSVAVTITDDVAATHFVASFIAGVRNAIAHCEKVGRSEQAVIITWSQDVVIIENSYVSAENCDLDRRAFDLKRERKEPGTETVLQYHERQMWREKPREALFSGLRKISCCPTPNSQFRHSWRTTLFIQEIQG